MWSTRPVVTKVLIISGVAAFTLALHYGWVVEPLFGHVHWFHVIHGRLCYIPVVIGATWFGLRGGLLTAGSISVLLIPYILGVSGDTGDVAAELAEIVFYFAIAVLIGVLVEREAATRQKQQEAQLQVERSQKLSLAGQIAAGVAHEIKNPLATIKGAADILTEDGTSAAERDEFKQILQSEIKRIDATVTEFLQFARPRETKLANLDLTGTVRASLRQIENQAKQRGLSIDTHIEESVVVNGDAEKLHQMILNLVLNAIHASRQNNTVNVTLTKDDRSARLNVSDSGIGIDEMDLKRVFEPFFTTKASGTGLGLAVVRAIVDSHNGDIVVASGKNRGTSVTVTIPLAVE